MNSSPGKRPRRRSLVLKILFISMLLFLVVEPIVMYRTLQHQREVRDEARRIVELVVSP